jgi:hypothetical protein
MKKQRKQHRVFQAKLSHSLPFCENNYRPASQPYDRIIGKQYKRIGSDAGKGPPATDFTAQSIRQRPRRNSSR